MEAGSWKCKTKKSEMFQIASFKQSLTFYCISDDIKWAIYRVMTNKKCMLDRSDLSNRWYS